MKKTATTRLSLRIAKRAGVEGDALLSGFSRFYASQRIAGELLTETYGITSPPSLRARLVKLSRSLKCPLSLRRKAERIAALIDHVARFERWQRDPAAFSKNGDFL